MYIQGVPIKTSDHVWFVNEKIIYDGQITIEKNRNRFIQYLFSLFFFIGALISLRKFFFITTIL